MRLLLSTAFATALTLAVGGCAMDADAGYYTAPTYGYGYGDGYGPAYYGANGYYGAQGYGGAPGYYGGGYGGSVYRAGGYAPSVYVAGARGAMPVYGHPVGQAYGGPRMGAPVGGFHGGGGFRGGGGFHGGGRR